LIERWGYRHRANDDGEEGVLARLREQVRCW